MGRLVTISVRGVDEDDWAYIVRYAQALGMTAGEFVSVWANALRERPQPRTLLEMMKQNRQRRVEFVRRRIFGDSTESDKDLGDQFL